MCTEPCTSRLAFGPKAMPCGLMSQTFAPGMLERSTPSMALPEGPVTRLMTLATDPGPEKVADWLVPMLNCEKLWNRLPPTCCPSEAGIEKLGPVSAPPAGPMLPSRTICAPAASGHTSGTSSHSVLVAELLAITEVL